MVKATLFGLTAGLIACYQGTTVRGGPAGVGNAVNETVVFSFVLLFFINIIITAIGFEVDEMSTGVPCRSNDFHAHQRLGGARSGLAANRRADKVLRTDTRLARRRLHPLPRRIAAADRGHESGYRGACGDRRHRGRDPS